VKQAERNGSLLNYQEPVSAASEAEPKRFAEVQMIRIFFAITVDVSVMNFQEKFRM
jgi:hypothetical protein